MSRGERRTRLKALEHAARGLPEVLMLWPQGMVEHQPSDEEIEAIKARCARRGRELLIFDYRQLRPLTHEEIEAIREQRRVEGEAAARMYEGEEMGVNDQEGGVHGS